MVQNNQHELIAGTKESCFELLLQQTTYKFRDRIEKEIKDNAQVINLSAWQDGRVIRSNKLQLKSVEGETQAEHSYIHSASDAEKKSHNLYS